MSKSVGRPTKKTDNTVRILEEAFMDGSTVTEACRIAEISRDSFYTWVEDDEEFSDRMETAQEYIDNIARVNIARAIKREADTKGKETETSKWWAERRLKEDFSQKVVNEHKGNIRHNVIAIPEKRNLDTPSETD